MSGLAGTSAGVRGQVRAHAATSKEQRVSARCRVGYTLTRITASKLVHGCEPVSTPERRPDISVSAAAVHRLNGQIMIQLVNLRKSFNKQEVLKGVSLEIPGGKTTAIIGRSGGGKSVLQNTSSA
jgi:ABC-type multidrug transport system fused ATPase/permease subunit